MIETFAFNISTLRKQFTKYCNDRLNELGISYGQLYIIIFIGRRNTCSPSDISTGLKLDAGHLNRTLNKLIENEFIIQTKNPNDGRAKILSLTDKGENVFRVSKELFTQWDQDVLSPLSEEEKSTLMQLLKKIR